MLRTELFQLALGYGLQQGVDKRALNVPELAVLKDAEFEEQGGLQTRKPTEAAGTDIFGGGDVEDFRAVVPYGNELLLFTKDKLYSRKADDDTWLDKGTHLAVKVDEETRFAVSGDQVDCDRAELAGVVVYSWTDKGTVWAAALDKVTGAVIVGPTMLGSGTGVGSQRARLVALDTRILLFFIDDTVSPDLMVKAIDPADPAAGFASANTTVLAGADSGITFDVTRQLGSDAAIGAIKKSGGTAYLAFRVAADLTLTSSTKARDCDECIAVACTPDGATMHVFRIDGTVDVEGDVITISGFVDVTVDQAIATAAAGPLQITAAYRDAAVAGVYTCHVFWSDGTLVETNTVTTAGTIGTKSNLVRLLDINSRAFARDGRVYLWLGFSVAATTITGIAAQFGYAVQNTYFLYRDDAFLCAKSVATKAGGAATAGYLPGVQALGDDAYAWCGVKKRVLVTGIGNTKRLRRQAYGAGSPVDIMFTFDSNEARRCAQLGATLYNAGGEVLQYDGVGLTEVGFHIYPHTLALGATTGDIEDGNYVYRMTARSANAKGDIDRSTTATHAETGALSGGTQGITVQSTNLYTTHKRLVDVPTRGFALEIWRTLKDPGTFDAPFYLVTDPNPNELTNPNRFVFNDLTSATSSSMTDELEDADVEQLATSPENGANLEPLAPPAASIIVASAERVFLAGIAGEPDTVCYSKQTPVGEIAAFHEQLAVAIPREGGRITALAFLNETLIVFRETAIYALVGDGFDNAGNGVNFVPRIVSLDVGAMSHEAVAVEPSGIVFQSRKGKYRLNRGWALQYIGGAVKDYDDEEVLAVHVVESQHQIRWVTGSRVLVLDYAATSQGNPVGQWSEWTLTNGVHACIWNGSWVFLSSSAGALVQQADYGDLVTYGIDLETPWIKMNDLQGAGRVRRILILGEHLGGAYELRVRLARNYEVDEDTGQPAWFDDIAWPRAGETVDAQYDVGSAFTAKIGPSIQRCTAIKIRITVGRYVTVEGNPDPQFQAPLVPAVKLTGIGLEVGIKPNLTRNVRVESKA